MKQSHGRSKGQPTQGSPEIRKCRYCKGDFPVNPRFPHKEFCTESHRKLHWRYGSLSVGKIAERIERNMRKFIAAELAPLRDRVKALERDFSLAESGCPPMNGDLSSLRARLDAIENFVRAFPSFTSSVTGGWSDPEAGEPAGIDWATIDANRKAEDRAKRGGGAGS